MVEHFYVKFVDPSYIVFKTSRGKKADKHTNAAKNVIPATAVDVYG